MPTYLRRAIVYLIRCSLSVERQAHNLVLKEGGSTANVVWLAQPEAAEAGKIGVPLSARYVVWLAQRLVGRIREIVVWLWEMVLGQKVASYPAKGVSAVSW